MGQKEIRDSEIKTFYSFKEKIGEGSFGKVYLAQKRETKNYFAVKVLKKDRIPNPTAVLAEIENLRKLDHVNLIRFYGSISTKKRLILE